MLSQDRKRGMAFATRKTAEAALRAGQTPGKGQFLWVTSVWLQDRGEGGHRFLGGMCILFLPQIQLAQNTISPCGEGSSLNNVDRKCWSVQKKSFRSHSKKEWLETEKSLDVTSLWMADCAWLAAEGHRRSCSSSSWPSPLLFLLLEHWKTLFHFQW